MRIFLSFNSKDTALAEALRDGVAGIEPTAEVFFSPISLGTGFWLPQLANEIAAADAFLLLVGPKGIGPWQEVEYYTAFDRHVADRRFVLVPVLAANAQVPGLPLLRNLNRIEAPIVTDDKALHRLLAALKGETIATATPLWKLVNPYRGLEAMTEADADYFYGRTAETVEVLGALADQRGRCPILIGASGVGKSSVAQAGVLSALKSMRWPAAEGKVSWPAGLANSRRWVQLTLRPGDAPLAALTAAVTRLWLLDARDPDQAALPRKWAERLRSGDNTLADLIGATQEELTKRGGEAPARILLYVDQGEELYTRSAAVEARRFSEVLAEGLGDGRFIAFASLRADYFDRLQTDEALFKSHVQINVAPLDRAQLKEMVTAPARALGVGFEDDQTSDRITTAAAAEPGAPPLLPLLSYLLTDMWDSMVKRGDATLRLPAQAIDVGGVLASRADEFLKANPEGETSLRRLLTLRLAAVPTEGEPVRRETRREECTESEWTLAGRLADHPWRLVVTSEREMDGEVIAEVAHEALLRAWPRLGGWLRDEREFLVFKGEAERAERRWRVMHMANNALLAGLDLARAEEWLPKRSGDLSPEVRHFVQRSIAADRAQKQQQLRFQRRVSLGAAAAALLMTIVGAFAWVQWRDAVRAQKLEEDQRQRAEQALAATMQIANTLVFDMGQDPRVRDLPVELLHQMLDRAIQGYDQAIRLNPDADAYSGRGGAYGVKGDYDHAIADYDQAIVLDPKDARAYTNRGKAYDDKGDYDRAIADFDQAIVINPKDARSYNNRGIAYDEKGDYDHAIADYDRAIVLDPKYAHAYYNRGNAYRDKRELDHAIADYDQAIVLDPKDARAYTNRGKAYNDKGDYDRAIADFDQAIVLDQKDARAYNNRGIAYDDKGDYDHAIADFDQAIVLDQKDARAYTNRGKAYDDKGDYDRAIADYDQAIVIDPKDARAYNNRGIAYDDKGDYDHAIADYDQAIVLDPKYSRAYYNRGNAYRDKRDVDHAIADYDQAIVLDPKDALVYNNRCWARVTIGRQLQQALSDCNEALSIQPNDADTLDSRGFAYLKLHRLDDAIADFDAALEIKPKLASSLYGRGLAKLKKDDRGGAEADMAAAKAIQAGIAEEFARYGIE